MVSTIDGNGFSLAEVQVSETTNEIIAISKLLDMLVYAP